MPKVDKLPMFKVILSNDDECPYSEITQALKLIFNYTESEAGEIAIEVHSDKAQKVLETIHGEKMALRQEQLKAWEKKSGNSLPITFKRVV
jgi:ATP-dependent Clp protease adapter protein ClpS